MTVRLSRPMPGSCDDSIPNGSSSSGPARNARASIERRRRCRPPGRAGAGRDTARGVSRARVRRGRVDRRCRCGSASRRSAAPSVRSGRCPPRTRGCRDRRAVRRPLGAERLRSDRAGVAPGCHGTSVPAWRTGRSMTAKCPSASTVSIATSPSTDARRRRRWSSAWLSSSTTSCATALVSLTRTRVRDLVAHRVTSRAPIGRR